MLILSKKIKNNEARMKFIAVWDKCTDELQAKILKVYTIDTIYAILNSDNTISTQIVLKVLKTIVDELKKDKQSASSVRIDVYTIVRDIDLEAGKGLKKIYVPKENYIKAS